MGMAVGDEEVTDGELIAVGKSWVIRALHGGDRGGHYTKLLSDIRDPSTSASALSIRLRGLSQAVSHVDERAHQGLWTYILGMSVWSYSEEVVDALLAFVVNLSTANGSFVSECLDMVVRNFLPPSCGLPTFLDSCSRTELVMGSLTVEKLRMRAAQHLANKDTVLERLHLSLVQILELVPTAAFRLRHIVVQRMPHRTVEKQWLALYVENLLRLVSSSLGGALGGQMLSLIVDRLVEIDVEIRWEDIMREDDSSKVFMFHMNLDDDDEAGVKSVEEGLSAADVTGPGCEAKHHQHRAIAIQRVQNGALPTLDEMAHKMDVMMDMAFEHLQMCVTNGHGIQVFEALIKSFQTTILETYESKFTQFLVFYMCSLAPATCGNTFTSLLCDIFVSKSWPAHTRMAAAAYLASFLARAKYLPLSVVLESVTRLLEWSVSYAQLAEDRRNPSMSTADPTAHGVFYSACQAVMYALCFRLKDLTEDHKLKRVLRNLPLQELVEHHLKPLNVCLPSVVEEFVKQASLAQLVDCRAWEDSREIAGAQIPGSFGGKAKLDMFFPFDPYLLRQSDRFIRPNFIHWSMVEPPDMQEESSEADDDFVNATFSEPSSSWEDDSLQDMDFAASLMGGLGHAFNEEEDLDMEESYSKRQGGTEIISTRGFEVGSFNSDDGAFVESFLDHMSYTPPRATYTLPRDLPRMPARLPAVLHPSLLT